MANVKIPELPGLASPSPSDLVPVADVSTANDDVKKTTVGEIVGIINGDVDVADDGTATISELPVSKLADGTPRQLLQTDAAGTGVEWTSNVDVPGTLGVTGQSTLASAAVSDLTSGRVVLAGASGELEDNAGLTFNGTQLDVDGDVVITGDLTVEGATTTFETQTVTVEDKNIELGVVGTPTDTTADGGGITLKGTTDKTINWVDATEAWTFSEHIDLASAKEFRIAGTKVLDATSLGSAVVSSSLTSVGTLTSGGLGAGFTTVATAQGGTGQTTYADGELLIGNATGNTLSKATLTAGTGISVTNSSGSIAVAIDSSVVTTNDTGTVTSTMISDDTIVNDDINASAAIADTKLDTISTVGKVSNSATTATDANTANAIVARDASGDFSAGTITANLTGNAATATKLNSSRTFEVTGDVTGTVSSDLTSGASIATSIASGAIVDADINASAAIAGTKIDPNFGSQTVKTTGVFSAAGGAESTPSITFTDDIDTGIYSPGADGVAISNGGTERLRVDGSGRLLVGTSSTSGNNRLIVQSNTDSDTGPATLLLAKGDNAPSSGGSLGLLRFSGDTHTNSAEIYAIRDGGTWTAGSSLPTAVAFSVAADGSALPTEAMRINSAGELLVGYTSDNGAYKLQVNSQIFASSATIATSDGRYKENVASLNGCLDLVKALRPVSFTWKPQEDITRLDEEGNEVLVREGHNFPEGTQVGFIAQEVQEVLDGKPWLDGVIKENVRPAVKDNDGNELAPEEQFYGIAEGNLIAVLTNALQEAVTEIEGLKARLDAANL